MTSTLAYYDRNAARFFESTVNVDMSTLHDRFLAAVRTGGHLLDAGCGSGRDTKVFLDKGYRVTAFDGSAELARMASVYTGIEVAVRDFTSVCEHHCYDGIWACASLLHLPSDALPSGLRALWNSLKPGSPFYLSFKLGVGERQDDGRHFTDLSERQLQVLLSELPDLGPVEYWESIDRRPGRNESWLNALAFKQKSKSERLVTGGTDPFLPHLSAAISRASDIDLAVAFIKTTGLRLLLSDLRCALNGNEEKNLQPARLRVLTSDYLDVTDPEALRLLMLLQELGAQVRVYESAGSSFHLKAYLFARCDSPTGLSGTAFIGSSNISRQALQNGLEWNYKIDYPGEEGFIEARARFDELFSHKRSVPLTDQWIAFYEARRVSLPIAVAPGSLEQDPPPVPTSIQTNALFALAESREEGYCRGLVVLATGLGKTWLAAFDAERFGAKRILFVAHREEILNQASETFLRIRPRASIGIYANKPRDRQVDVLCASVQTLSRDPHLDRFPPEHFDYIVIDEFHHAAATTYRKILQYFSPRFLLGLTATPDRSDQSDILSLCDDNLVFSCGLFDGIRANLLVPFHYYGIFDTSVDYAEIPWRSGRFDPEQLSNKLATLARAKHALNEWNRRKLTRTLAFCVSISHAEYMAAQFAKAGVNCAAVYIGSQLSRADALERLRDGRLFILFSVDLFNEGVDLPAIDTVMLLRPTESKILFLQQLGRGLRKSDQKEKLVVLDFIGNHKSFLHKPQALFGIDSSYKKLAEFARGVERQALSLPDGCYVNYDLELIEFLKSLDSDGVANDYRALRDGLGRRPTLSEFYRSGSIISSMRRDYGDWFALVQEMGDLGNEEQEIAVKYREFLRAVEITSMTKSFKMILLEAFQELNGWSNAPTTPALSERSWQVLQRRRILLGDLPTAQRQLENGDSREWQHYWFGNPISAWIGRNSPNQDNVFFRLVDNRFGASFNVDADELSWFEPMVQELVDYRLAMYAARREVDLPSNVIPFVPKPLPGSRIELPYFPNLKIACGHFKTGSTEAEEYRALGAGHGTLNPERHFIARASGNSMNGGKHPIVDGDYLLLEHITSTSAGSITGAVVAIERYDETGAGNQYLLRTVLKSADGSYLLRANNPDYEDLPATEEMRTLARLKEIIDPIDMALHQSFFREEIPPLFGEEFNVGSWNAGHVSLAEKQAVVLLVTINKQGKAEDHRYLDHWIDDRTFHWQSQNSTSPSGKKGREIIDHIKNDLKIHLFVRENKLCNGKAAPFIYRGTVRYRTHTGSSPMSVVFDLESG